MQHKVSIESISSSTTENLINLLQKTENGIVLDMHVCICNHVLFSLIFNSSLFLQKITSKSMKKYSQVFT